ncbi:hypothetical protein [Moorena sp. SIO1G6]|nr:hypothetical protein [Moorena sp. SIO1G6]
MKVVWLKVVWLFLDGIIDWPLGHATRMVTFAMLGPSRYANAS